jgi:hypothetical protein
MNNQWSPSWSEAEINQASQKVGQSLKQGLYSNKIAKAQSQCRGKSWWDRQFNIIARGACSSLKEVDKKINGYKRDTPRVLRLIRNQWRRYSQLVISQHGATTCGEMIDIAQDSPAEFYVYLVTVHTQKPWLNSRPGYEASLQSSWSKIGTDNQFLWSMAEFKKVFL